MSQTTGEPGHDPEKDEWLKHFSGIPNTYEPDELHNDRPYFDKKMRERSPGYIEGQLDDLGEGMANAHERYRDKHHSLRHSWSQRIVYGIITAVAFWVAIVHYLPF